MEERELAGMRLFAARTSALDVVRIEGSVLGGKNLLTKNKGQVAALVAELLDAGTAKRSMDAIREELSARGITLMFSASGDRLLFSASCLPEDVSYTCSVIVECLMGATFPEKELKLAKARLVGQLTEAKSDTQAQASIAHFRLTYGADHPNYPATIDERIKQVESATRAELRAHREKFGKTGLVLSVVGDISAAKTLDAVSKIFGKLPAGVGEVPVKQTNAKQVKATEQIVTIKDKSNVDVYAGTPVGFTYDDARYVPFIVLLDLLGGRGLSSGHFMRTIRERDGLTYGIYALPCGFEDGSNGAYRIWATFAPSVYPKGITAIKKEIGVFLAKGLTEEALANKKDEMVGRYLIGLSTAQGLARALHRLGAEGKPLSYIEEYPDLLRALTVADLKKIAPLLDVNKLVIAAAGTLP